MLHIVHMIERRYGQKPGAARIVARLLAASLLALLLGAGFLLSNTTRAQDAASLTTSAETTASALAIQMLDHLDAGEFVQAEAMFNATMAQAVPADKLQAVWESLPAQAGEAKGRGDAASATQREMTLVSIPLLYVKASLVAKFAIDAQGKIAGFLIQPEAAPPAAAVTEDAPYTETDLNVGEAEVALPGTLAMPNPDSTARNMP